MATHQSPLPPGFKPWPQTPEEAQDLVDEIEQAWENRRTKNDPDRAKADGPHWALKVVGYNPISGYQVPQLTPV